MWGSAGGGRKAGRRRTDCFVEIHRSKSGRKQRKEQNKALVSSERSRQGGESWRKRVQPPERACGENSIASILPT